MGVVIVCEVILLQKGTENLIKFSKSRGNVFCCTKIDN